NDAHAASTAAGRSLDDDGISDLARDFSTFFFRRHFAWTTRHDGQTRLVHRAARFNLVAHQTNDVCRWSNKLDVARFTDLSEVRRLGEKSVTRMDRIDVEDLSGADDGGNVEITLRGRRWSNTRRFVGETDVQRIAIDVAVNSDSLDTHLLASP